MRVGVPREVKQEEFRVALTPAAALELSGSGHEVTVETTAGEGSGFADDDDRAAGAHIAAGVNVACGVITHHAVADAHDLPFEPVSTVLAAGGKARSRSLAVSPASVT